MEQIASPKDGSTPSAADIERALKAHVHRGPSPEPAIRAALYPLASVVNAMQLSPGSGAERPTYSLKISGLGLTIERQSVKRVAARLHEISAALTSLAVGDQANPDAPEHLVTTMNTQVRIRSSGDAEIRKAMAILGNHRFATIHAPVPISEIEEACRTAVAWARAPHNLPAGLLRLTRNISLFLDRVRLQAVLASIDIPGTRARILFPLTKVGAPQIVIEGAPSTHARIRALSRMRDFAQDLICDRDNWLTDSLPDEPETTPTKTLCLAVGISTEGNSQEISISITDNEGRRIAPFGHDRSADLLFDSSTIHLRSLFHALRPAGLRHWMVDLSGKPGASLIQFAGTNLAEALAAGRYDGTLLDHAALSRFLGRVATHRASGSQTNVVFLTLPKT